MTQAVVLAWTAEPFINTTNRRQSSSTALPEDRVVACSDPFSHIRCTDFDYHATLTSVSAIQNRFADMTSTFMFTASARINGTIVQCKGVPATEDQIASSILNVTGGLHTHCMCMVCLWKFIALNLCMLSISDIVLQLWMILLRCCETESRKESLCSFKIVCLSVVDVVLLKGLIHMVLGSAHA